MNREINYYVYSPSGNDTALVEGIDFNADTKKIINDEIMKLNSNIEQVGFVDPSGEPTLIMAGGEFCGNATRCAAYYYLKGKSGERKIKVSGVNNAIYAGIDDEENTWCNGFLESRDNIVRVVDNGIYEVKLEGITHIIVESEQSVNILKNKDSIKEEAMNIIEKYKIADNDAIGVMFIEYVNEALKINPIVWVKSIDTLFYESACASGSIAASIYKSYIQNKNQSLDILQPSGQILKAKIIYENNKLEYAIISGKIKTDGIVRKLYVDI